MAAGALAVAYGPDDIPGASRGSCPNGSGPAPHVGAWPPSIWVGRGGDPERGKSSGKFRCRCQVHRKSLSGPFQVGPPGAQGPVEPAHRAGGGGGGGPRGGGGVIPQFLGSADSRGIADQLDQDLRAHRRPADRIEDRASRGKGARAGGGGGPPTSLLKIAQFVIMTDHRRFLGRRPHPEPAFARGATRMPMAIDDGGRRGRPWAARDRPAWPRPQR